MRRAFGLYTDAEIAKLTELFRKEYLSWPESTLSTSEATRHGPTPELENPSSDKRESTPDDIPER